MASDKRMLAAGLFAGAVVVGSAAVWLHRRHKQQKAAASSSSSSSTTTTTTTTTVAAASGSSSSASPMVTKPTRSSSSASQRSRSESVASHGRGGARGIMQQQHEEGEGLRTLYRDISLLVTMDDDDRDIENAFILVNGCAIEALGPMQDAPPDSHADVVVDMAGRVVVPGLVNTHHHMFQSLTRCVAQGKTLFGWLKELYPIWRNMRAEHVYVSAKMTMAEMILSGCTMSSDHLYIYPNDCKLDDEVRAARELGMRFHPSRGAMTTGESDGGLPPDCVVEKEEDIIVDMKRVIQLYHDPERYAMTRIVLAPCSPFTVTDSLMRRSAELARQHKKVHLHTHLAEDDNDIEYSLERFGKRPGQYIKDLGWTGPDVWHAHCCKLNQEEQEMFAATGTGLSHCPSSNLRLGSGIAPIVTMLNNKVKVSLGVDGSASNDSGNVLSEARLCMLLQRVGEKRAAAIGAREALRLATRGGASVLGREECGYLAPGMAADFVAWSTDDPGFAGALHDKLAALLFCIPSKGVDTSVINGRQVVRHGVLLTADLRDLVVRHNKLSAELFDMRKADLAREGQGSSAAAAAGASGSA